MEIPGFGVPGREEGCVNYRAGYHAGQRCASRELVPADPENKKRGNLGQDLHLKLGQPPKREPRVEGDTNEPDDKNPGKGLTCTRQPGFIGAT